jgi:hypothetical protein
MLAVAGVGSPADAGEQPQEHRAVNPSILMGAPIAAQVRSLDLFGDIAFSPGFSAQASFTVHNATNQAGLLSLALDKAYATDSSLLSVLTVSAQAANSGAPRQASFASASQCPMLMPETPIAANGDVTIMISVGMGADVTGLQHSTQQSSFDFVADMHDANMRIADASQVCSANGANVKLVPAPGTSTGPGNTHSPGSGKGGGGSTSPSIGTQSRPTSSGPLAWTGANLLLVVIVAISMAAGGFGCILAARRRFKRGEGALG